MNAMEGSLVGSVIFRVVQRTKCLAHGPRAAVGYICARTALSATKTKTWLLFVTMSYAKLAAIRGRRNAKESNRVVAQVKQKAKWKEAAA